VSSGTLITLAPTGAESAKDDVPALPVTVEEVVATAQERDGDDFMDTLRVDLFDDEVFVFTPAGEVKALPSGATQVSAPPWIISVGTPIVRTAAMRCSNSSYAGSRGDAPQRTR